jgi:hypothetical protein
VDFSTKQETRYDLLPVPTFISKNEEPDLPDFFGLPDP